MVFMHLDDVLLQAASRAQQSRYTPTSAVAAVFMCTSRREVNAGRLWKCKQRNAPKLLSLLRENRKKKEMKHK